ncbi:MAG TPA: 6,7-dimethyl-8-ribityllumazine synthase [Pyrinomonadaceae bacterium]|jgi:6,7-dimethyl-8-ribityllumazine synthase|nr:6,7-dimethyl-8-ribityllumazine synthase [Pyrinomonadaceae bacterium]
MPVVQKATQLACAETHHLYSKSVGSPLERSSKLLQPVIHEGHLNAQGFRFAVVASRWNDFISSRLVDGALDALERLGADEKLVHVYKVPGAFELPLLGLRLAESEKFDAIICVGTIIRGQTPHFDYIAGEVTRGIGEAGLQTGVPVVFGVVTADTIDQAIDRAGVKLGNKGFEAATTAVELANLYKAVFEKDEG